MGPILRTSSSGIAGALVLALALATPAAGQFPEAPFTTGVGAVVEGYRFDGDAREVIEGIVLGTAPFDAAVGLGSMVDLAVRGAYARGVLFRPDGRELTLQGLTDTQVRLTVAPGDGTLAFSVIGYLPTGASSHDAEEAAVAGVVASDLLPFRISNWGTGGGVALHGAAARRFGNVGAGLAASWRFSSEFEPVAGRDAAYRPGSELRLRGALDVDIGAGSKVSLAATWYDYAEDRFEGQNLYRSGDRLEAYASLAFPMGRRASGALYGGLLHREHGTFVDPSVPAGRAQDLLLAGLRTRAPLGGVVHVQSFDARFFQPEDGVGEGWMLGTEAAFVIPAGALSLTPTIGGRLGRLDVRGTDVTSRVFGGVFGLSLRARR